MFAFLDKTITPKNVYGYIYCTFFPSGHFYIGQHRSWTWDYGYYGSGRFLHCWIQGRGLMKSMLSQSGLICKLLAWAYSAEELNQLEFEFIKKVYNDPRCKNFRPGGNQPGTKPESIEKMRQANLGKKLSIETKRSISKGHLGQVPWNKGLKQTEDSNQKRRETMKQKPVKRVICVETGEELELRKTSEKYKVHSSKVVLCCSGSRKSTGGYHWKWAPGFNSERKRVIVYCVELQKQMSLKEAQELTGLKSRHHIIDATTGLREIAGGYHWRLV